MEIRGVICYLSPFLLLVCGHGGHLENEIPTVEPIKTMDIKMPGAVPKQDDHYLCTSYPVNNGYVVGYKALADASTAHHILMYACSKPYQYNGVWECGSICRGQRAIMFAWAKNAPPLHLPKDVGYQIGKDADVNYIVMQIHYAHALPDGQEPDHSGIQLQISEERQKYKAGIFLLMSIEPIPPHNPKVHLDVSCKFEGTETIYPFGFRTHAHSLSRVISGYQYNGTWNRIGKGNPQWPQAFYPAENKIAIRNGDSLAARCTYDSTDQDKVTFIGSTAADEMCNFYVMYYTDALNGHTSGSCMYNTLPQLAKRMPADSDVELPPNPALDDMASGHHHHHHAPGNGGDVDQLSSKGSTKVSPPPHSELPPLVPARSQLPAMETDSNWPLDHVDVGQVGGLDTDKDGNLYIFHRASRVWDGTMFNVKNIFLHQDEPIKENTLLKIGRDGRVLKEWGSNQFYMPHGITVDQHDNIWVTDVALHQVMRFAAGSNVTDLVLGTRFVPKHDNVHFCKPTGVSVMSSGEFFIADGYCNSRILKFSQTGELIGQWGSSSLGEPAQADGFPPTNTFDIVHSIALAEDKNLVCAADRENARIQCYDLSGSFVKQITNPKFGSSVYSIAYCPQNGGVLYVINGPSPYHHRLSHNEKIKAQGFAVNINSGEIIGSWQPSNENRAFSFPHAVAVDCMHNEVYVGEIGPNLIWKFVSNSGKKTTERTEEIIKTIGTTSPKTTKEDSNKAETESQTASIVIGTLLVVPVVIMIIVAIVMKLRSKGKLDCCSLRRGRKPVFNYFTSHKGFDPLSTEESDHEIDPLNDSDAEDYTIPPKA